MIPYHGSTTPSFGVTLNQCGYCGGYHTGMCGMIKAIEYFPDGTIKRVELKDYNQKMESDLPRIDWPTIDWPPRGF